MLPKFLLADNSQEVPDTLFIVHTEYPKFIIEFDVDDFRENQEIHWMDPKIENEEELDDLLDEVEAFLEDELDNQEDLYDEEENS
ncbi:MAG: hypothetical protein N4A32_05065 [Marinifilaceae bacterium]|jgi:hypothetical protein|nr:hypothetical protein [Marinifilaceae bacterium]